VRPLPYANRGGDRPRSNPVAKILGEEHASSLKRDA
jgi:hypothetical protein